MANEMGYNDLDPDMSVYPPGATVIGRDRRDGAGNIKGLKVHITPGGSRNTGGGVARFVCESPDEQPIFDQVNQLATELMDDTDFMDRNPQATRAGIIHSKLAELLVPYRQHRDAMKLAAMANVTVSTSQPVPVAYQAAPTVTPSVVSQTVQAAAIDMDGFRQATQMFDVWSSLGIKGLGPVPFEASYAEVKDVTQGSSLKLRYHWAFRIDDEAVFFVRDMRGVKSGRSKQSQVLSFKGASLQYGETVKALRGSPAYGILPVAQSFSFGVFEFYVFLLAI